MLMIVTTSLSRHQKTYSNNCYRQVTDIDLKWNNTNEILACSQDEENNSMQQRISCYYVFLSAVKKKHQQKQIYRPFR